MKENENWYNRRYNEDATQRADAQRLLSDLNDNVRQRNQAVAGTQAVTGGTEESVAASKAANNRAIADVVSQIAANGEQRKDAIEGQYMNRKTALNDQLNNLGMAKAQSIAAAAQGLGETTTALGADIDDYLDKRQQ